MKLIALLIAGIFFFGFALQNAVKDITYPASVPTAVQEAASAPVTETTVPAKLVKSKNKVLLRQV